MPLSVTQASIIYSGEDDVRLLTDGSERFVPVQEDEPITVPLRTEYEALLG